MSSEFWLVALSNTFHLLATIIWIGWSVLLPVVVAPNLADAFQEGNWRSTVLRRLPLAYGAIIVLWATGMLQMSANENYEGMLAVTNVWSVLLLLKHLLILASIVLMVYLSQQLSPAVRLALRRDALGKENRRTSLEARFGRVAWLNLIVCIAILAATGLLTAVP